MVLVAGVVVVLVMRRLALAVMLFDELLLCNWRGLLWLLLTGPDGNVAVKMMMVMMMMMMMMMVVVVVV